MRVVWLELANFVCYETVYLLFGAPSFYWRAALCRASRRAVRATKHRQSHSFAIAGSQGRLHFNGSEAIGPF